MNKFHQNSKDKGFWDNCRYGLGMLDLEPDKVQESIPVKLCLIHSEVSEALEDFRTGALIEYTDGKGKPLGLPSELADVVIRCFDLAGALGIDLDAAIERKHAYNLGRSRMHGGKRI